VGVHWGGVIPEAQALTFPNERCIEVPLGYEAAELHQPGWVLDAGCGLNRHMGKSYGTASVLHVTQSLRSEDITVGSGRRSYMEADLRNLRIFASGGFERTVCLSTLEHIGMDNTVYGGPVEADPQSMLAAVHELCRVTRRVLLLTVPFNAGKFACPEWRYFHPDDLADLAHLAADYGFTSDVRFYAKNDAGKWYGGERTPAAATQTDFPGKVNAFAAMRCVRE
jgi:hypothetical protein